MCKQSISQVVARAHMRCDIEKKRIIITITEIQYCYFLDFIYVYIQDIKPQRCLNLFTASNICPVVNLKWVWPNYMHPKTVPRHHSSS